MREYNSVQVWWSIRLLFSSTTLAS